MSFREWSALLYFQTLLKKIKGADQILPEVYGTTLTWIGELQEATRGDYFRVSL
jgi:hypothetical protein